MGGHPKLAVAVGPHDHALGASGAPLTLVQYGDYACPYTRRASANVALARRKLGKRVRYVFRHFPREALNPESVLLAEAAHAAGAQGRFWEMHQRLLDDDEGLDGVAAHAEVLGLDVGRLLSELQARTWRSQVAEELEGGLRSGVSSTPTFFVNGTRHVGSWEPMALCRALGGAPALARSAHL
jgi:protein-disulfide isomerase